MKNLAFTLSVLVAASFFASPTFASAVNANGLPTESSDNGLAVIRASSIQVPEAASNQDSKENQGSDREVALVAQGMEWCYTSAGPFPMAVWMLPGSACHVNVAFYPYVLYGVVGY